MMLLPQFSLLVALVFGLNVVYARKWVNCTTFTQVISTTSTAQAAGATSTQTNSTSSSNSTYAASNYTSFAESAFQTLQGWYNTTSGLWNTCGWWNGANCMTVIADLAAVDASVLATATSIFASTYSLAPKQNPSNNLYKVSGPGVVRTYYEKSPWNSINPGSKNVQARDFEDQSIFERQSTSGGNAAGFLDSCYDDNSWWALAWIAAYDLTNNTDYLDTAAGIFTNLTGAWPTNCSDGGIYWCSTSTYVNAIANELFLSVAAHLANRVPSNSAYYVSWAQREWAWFQQSQFINSEGTINDGLGAQTCTGNRSLTVWSYNQGVILGGLVELNRASPNSSYIDSANSIAQAAIANLTDSNHVLHDVCEPDCAPDATQFKGIFVRNLAALQAVSPNSLYTTVIQANADSIWTNDRDTSNNSLSIDWAGPFVNWVNASTHSSAMDALVAAVAIGS